jgi:hypothetical protein
VGWHALRTKYDDGGFSGGTMDRRNELFEWKRT